MTDRLTQTNNTLSTYDIHYYEDKKNRNKENRNEQEVKWSRIKKKNVDSRIMYSLG